MVFPVFRLPFVGTFRQPENSNGFFFHVPHVFAKFHQPPVQHGAVGQLGLEAVVLGYFLQDDLVGGEFGLGEMKTRHAVDGKAQADFFAVAKAEMSGGAVVV